MTVAETAGGEETEKARVEERRAGRSATRARTTRTSTLNNSRGNISIFKGDGIGFRSIAGVEPKILIDREIAGAMPRFEQMERAQTWFVCPKDHAVLRVPEEKADQSWKCPVDGTEMEKRKGRGFAFLFDHEDHL